MHGVMSCTMELLLIAGCFLHGFASAASATDAGFAGLSDLTSEEQALEVLGRPGAVDIVLASAGLEEGVEKLVHRGWHDAVRTLVARSQTSSEESAQKVAAQVRHAVYAERNRLDDLIRALDRNYGRAVDVSPAMQWAQNSTHVFLAVKFAQRWNAPGALEVENETVAFSACCFNFTAFGEHSFIRRKYHLSFELFRPISASSSSWFLAAAGRVTVMIAKASPGNWPQLFRNLESQPKNLGIWRDMHEKWKKDLEKFPVEGGEPSRPATPPSSDKKVEAKKRKAKRKRNSDDDDEALDREVDLLGECPKSTFAGTSVAELCGKVFTDVAENPAVAGRRWLLEMYSSTGTGDLAAMRDMMPMWKRLADTSPWSAFRVGAVDCGYEKELCKRLGATKLPQIWRFAAGKGESWPGGDTSIESLVEWGAGTSKDEL